MRWLRLGLRLSIGTRHGAWHRVLLMCSGSALGMFVVLACLASASVATAQQAKAQARTPIQAGADPSLPRLSEVGDAYGGRALTRILVANAGAASPTPPGVGRLPQNGQAVASPALLALIRDTPLLQHEFHQQLIGTIGEAGLVAPDELRIYVGVPADALTETAPTAGFGAPLQLPATVFADVNVFIPGRAIALAFALFVLVPLGTFLATCTRLSASVRDRRTAALRLLGVSARQATLLSGIETGVVAIGGALLGMVVWLVVAPWSQGWRIGRLHWYAADATVPAGWICGSLVAVVGFSAAIGMLATRPARVAALTIRRHGAAGRPRAWRALPLAAGIVAAWIAAGGFPTRSFGLTPAQLGIAMGIAIMLIGLGLIPIVPLTCYAFAGALTRRSAPVWLSLAGARLRHRPGVAPRVVSSLTVAVFVVGVAVGGSAVIVASTQRSAVGGTGLRTLLVFTPDGTPAAVLPAAALRVVPHTYVAVQAETSMSVPGEPDTSVELKIGDCASLAAQFVIDEGRCVDGGAYRLVYDGGLPWSGPQPGTNLVALQGGLRLKVPSATLRVAPRAQSPIPANLWVTASSPLLAGQPGGQPRLILLVGDLSVRDELNAIVVGADPTLTLTPFDSTRLADFDLQGRGHRGLDADLVTTVIVAGLLLGLTLGVASFAVAALDNRVERRRDNTTLVVVGTPPRTLAATEIVTSGVPFTIGLSGAVATALYVTWSLARLNGNASRHTLAALTPITGFAGLALLAGFALIAIPALITRPVRASDLHRE